MIRRTGSWLSLPLDERGRVVLTEEELDRVFKAFRVNFHERWWPTRLALQTAIQALVPEESNEQE